MSKLQWTKKKPTKTGWYWRKCGGSGDIWIEYYNDITNADDLDNCDACRYAGPLKPPRV